ncbi:MAG: RsmD family RNA methyltransferase [Candidatus Omnitrophica bacterium]|nr:RsmD family RNA methyltransferase [Candidatus Omnitrophota bacterium]
MRIIAGRFKSRLICSPKGVDLRPTSDRVKESLFGILGAFVMDKAALDLFGGTGNLGIEALSRGAGSCVFVDSNPRCVAAIKKNLEALGIVGITPHPCLTGRQANPLPIGEREFDKWLPGGERECHGQVVLKDAFKYVKEAKEKGLVFDIIFLDPPYYKDMVRKSLILLDNYNIITQSSVIVAEHHRKDELPRPEELRAMRLYRQEEYGGTFLSFYR